jgi:cytochrome c-type biogenesis protein CcmH
MGARTKRTKRLVLMGVLALAVVVLLAAGRGNDGNSVQARTDRIATSFKCPTCQGLSVAQSKANTAKAIYAEIQRQVQAGQTDEEIRTYLVSRFGEQQLLRPETTGIGSIAWIAPVVVLVSALGWLLLKFRKTKVNPVAVSDADRKRVAKALSQFQKNRS